MGYKIYSNRGVSRTLKGKSEKGEVMNFEELLKKRRSVREFLDKEVEEEKIKKLLWAAKESPSAGNLQSYEIIVVRNREKIREIAFHGDTQSSVARAPVLFVICANRVKCGSVYGKRGHELYSVVDAAIAGEHIHLMAVELGLGSVWIGAFDPEGVKEVLNIPEGVEPIALMPIGYPKATPEKVEKNEKFVHWEEW
jgi:nitroreductase